MVLRLDLMSSSIHLGSHPTASPLLRKWASKLHRWISKAKREKLKRSGAKMVKKYQNSNGEWKVHLPQNIHELEQNQFWGIWLQEYQLVACWGLAPNIWQRALPTPLSLPRLSSTSTWNIWTLFLVILIFVIGCDITSSPEVLSFSLFRRNTKDNFAVRYMGPIMWRIWSRPGWTQPAPSYIWS